MKVLPILQDAYTLRQPPACPCRHRMYCLAFSFMLLPSFPLQNFSDSPLPSPPPQLCWCSIWPSLPATFPSRTPSLPVYQSIPLLCPLRLGSHLTSERKPQSLQLELNCPISELSSVHHDLHFMPFNLHTALSQSVTACSTGPRGFRIFKGTTSSLHWEADTTSLILWVMI